MKTACGIDQFCLAGEGDEEKAKVSQLAQDKHVTDLTRESGSEVRSLAPRDRLVTMSVCAPSWGLT